jgi:DNA-binding NarL/FixJ family response regulator
VSATRIIVVEDEPLFRQLLRVQLSANPDIEVVGEAATGEQAVELAEALEPEVVLMDIELGSGITGIQAGHMIKSRRPSTGIVLLSNYRAKQFIVASAGWSYLMKRNVRDLDSVVRAIKGAAWGMLAIDPQVTETLKPRTDTPLARLEPQQLKVLELLSQGLTDKAIADELVIAEKTVQKHLDDIYSRLNISREGKTDPRVAAVRAYLEQTRGN